MDVLQAIHERRSIGKVKSELPPKELIDQLLEAATWAPNHFRVEPWRFFVLTGKSRERLGDVFAEVELEANPEASESVVSGARSRPLRSPVLIAVAVNAPQSDREVEIENVAAVAAGVQNMLLTAHSLGLGAMWRTGDYAYHPKVKAFFGLNPDERLLAFVYVGYPDMDPPPAKRTPASEKTAWWGDAEGDYSPAS